MVDDGGIGGTAFPPGQPLLRRPKHQGSVGLTYLGERWTVAFIANLRHESYEEALGFSAAGIRVRGGITANF